VEGRFPSEGLVFEGDHQLLKVAFDLRLAAAYRPGGRESAYGNADDDGSLSIRIVHLYYYEGYRVNEIAKLLGTSENTVKSHLFRARDMLREQLKGEFQDV